MNRSERSAFFRYRLLARFAEILPVSGVNVIAGAAGRLGPALNGHQARLVKANLRRVMSTEPTDADVRHTYESYVRYWLNAFRLPIVPKDYLERVFRIEGYDNLTAAREAGKGVILALPHVGNWDVAGAWLTSRGVPLTVVAERLQPAELHTWFEEFRQSIGMTIVTNGPDVASKLQKALKRNDVVALLCDRDVDGTGGDYRFFGEVTKLPKGPALLALRTGAALLPAVAYESGSGFQTVIEPPIAVERSAASLRVDVDRVTKALTTRIEGLIRREPTQWHLFQPNWPSDRKGVVAK